MDCLRKDGHGRENVHPSLPETKDLRAVKTEMAVSCVETVRSRMKWEHWGGESLSLFFLAASSMAFPLQRSGWFAFLFCTFLPVSPQLFFLRGSEARETMLSKDRQSSQEGMGDSTDAGPAARVPAQPHSKQATLGRLFNLFRLSCLAWEISYSP